MESPRLEMQCDAHSSHETQLDAMAEDIATLKSKVAALETSGALYGDRIQRIFDDIDDLKRLINNISDKLDTIAQRPGRRWDGLIDKGIAALVGAAVAYFIGR